MLDDQLGIRSQLDRLQHTVDRMRRSFIVANVLTAGVATCFTLLVVFLYTQPRRDLHVAGGGTIVQIPPKTRRLALSRQHRQTLSSRSRQRSTGNTSC